MASDTTSGPAAGWWDRLAGFGDRTAVLDPDGAHTLAEILGAGRAVAATLLAGRADLDGDRVAVVCRPGREFCAALLGVWLAGGVAVPLHPAHPLAELSHPVTDAGVAAVVCSPHHRQLAEALGRLRPAAPVPLVDVPPRGSVDRAAVAPAMPAVDPERPALMVYTSGTTGAPKGAVHTHRSVIAQVTSMAEAWEWSGDDRVLLALPLHHVHGIVNVTLTALWSGAICEAQGGFEPLATWERLASGRLTLFMAVPTIYARLTAAWEAADEATRARWSDGAARLRLMVSGSAALPVATLDRWEHVTGQRLLERYGMTELGMVLGNRLDRRVPGHVGWPFPGVEVRIVGDDGHEVEPGEPGELQVRGPQVFAGYWNRPEATAASFVDGWFRTGDVAAVDPEGYRLLGRASVDILKTGGEKVSALEIEEVFRTHPAVADCAVVGVPDDEWGDRVCIAVVARPGRVVPPIDELRAWGKERLAPAKVPTEVLVVEDLPRNALGKVIKPAVSALFAAG